VCVSHLNYPICKARCCLSRSTLLSALSQKPYICLKNLLTAKVWFDFLYNIYENFLILSSIQQDPIKCILVIKWGTHYSCHILMNLDFYRHNFKKFSNIKFHENRPVGTELFQKDCHERYAHDKGWFSNFWHPAQEPTHTHTHTHTHTSTYTHVLVSYHFIKHSLKLL